MLTIHIWSESRCPDCDVDCPLGATIIEGVGHWTAGGFRLQDDDIYADQTSLKRIEAASNCELANNTIYIVLDLYMYTMYILSVCFLDNRVTCKCALLVVTAAHMKRRRRFRDDNTSLDSSSADDHLTTHTVPVLTAEVPSSPSLAAAGRSSSSGPSE